MADFIEIPGAGELKDGEMKMTTLGEIQVLIAKVGNSYYAAENRCPHMGGDLSRGHLEGSVVTCPRHGSQFDLKDGHVIRWTNWTGIAGSVARIVKSPRPIKTFEVKLEDGKVMVSSSERVPAM